MAGKKRGRKKKPGYYCTKCGRRHLSGRLFHGHKRYAR